MIGHKSVRTEILALASLIRLFTMAPQMDASENVPHAPFGEWAEVPTPGQWVIALHYQESESYSFWDAHQRYNVDWRAAGERHGIDINQGFLAIQYGITEKWAGDLAIGGTTTSWRYFSNFSATGEPQSTRGLMDTALGLRYQLW